MHTFFLALDQNFWTHLKAEALDFLFALGTKLIYVIIAAIIGAIIIKLILKLIRKIMDKAKVELSLRSFISSLSTFLLYAVLVIVIGVILGIQTSAFLTLLGAAGIAIGLALQGSLSNFAGGVLILAFKPFRIGDKVIIHDIFGVVHEVNILYTRLKTYDGKIITMPNGNVSNSDIENRSALPERRVELKLGFSYEDDMDKIREIVQTTMEKHPKLVEGQPVQVWFNGTDDKGYTMSARCWSDTWEFWLVYWNQLEAVLKALKENGINPSIPKRELRYLKENGRLDLAGEKE